MAYTYRKRNPETGEMEFYQDPERTLFANNLGSIYNILPGNMANLGNAGYTSGFDYARSIAGGMPMSQVIAPGVSYSPEQPMGYTQAQLNGDIPVEKPVAPPPPVRDDQIFVPPVTPPVTQLPDDPGFLGTGIGGVTIPFDRQQVPAQLPQIDLSGIDFSQIQIPEEFRTGLQGLLGIPQIDTETLKADILGQVPTFDPTGLQTRLGALESQQIPVFDPSGLQEQITSLQQRPGFDPSGLQEQIAQLQAQPGFDPSGIQQQIAQLQARPGFDPSAIQEQITALQQRPGFDPSGLQEQIGLLQQQVPSRDDFMSIQQDIAELSAREIPQFDPTGLQQQIQDLQQRPGFDPTGLQEQISGLQQSLGEIPQFDPSNLQQQIAALQQQPGFDPSGLQEQITQISQRPGFDPTQLQQQIAELQTRPGFDPTGLQQQIAGLQESFGQITPFDPTTLQQRLGILEQQVPTRDDFMSIQQDISQLQTRPQFDPTGLQQQIGSLEQQIGSIPQFDPSGLQQQISALQQRPGFDPSTLQEQITALQQRPGFDPSGIQEQISGLQQSIGDIPMFDPSGLQEQISALQGREIPIFDPTGLQQQIAANQAAIAGIDIPTYQAPDLSGFATQEDIQAALAGIPQQPQVDISGLLSRISELESNLSALQQPTGGQFSIAQQLPMRVS